MQASRLNAAFECARAYVNSGHLPTAVVGVSLAGKVVGTRAYGAGGVADNVLLDRSFALASISKAITGTALAVAWERGLVDYDEPICESIPEFASDERRRRITIRHILTHTSGLPSRFADSCTAGEFSRESILRLLYSHDPVSQDPGTVMAYSSYTYQLINEFIQRRLKLSMTDFLTTFLFEPLGMADTGFAPSDWSQAVPVVDHPVPYGETMHRYCALEMSGSGMWSTLGDLLRLGQAVVSSGDFLRDGARGMLLTVALAAPKAGAEEARSARTLGWVKEPQAAFASQPECGIYHGGATGTLLWLDPERELVFAFLTNRWGSGNDHAFDVLSKLY